MDPTTQTPLISESDEATQTDRSASLLKELATFGPHQSEMLVQAGVEESQSAQLTERPKNQTKWAPDKCKRHQDRHRTKSKIQSRISHRDQVPGFVELFSVGPAICQDQVHAEIPVKVRNDEDCSSGVVGPDAREELRRLLASGDHVSSIEERIRCLEKENVEMLLEIWRSKLEFARVNRELRCELFRLRMERILNKL